VSNNRQGVIGTSDDAFAELAAETVNRPPPTTNTAAAATQPAQRERPAKRTDMSPPIRCAPPARQPDRAR
jgi:hypothetical protein